MSLTLSKNTLCATLFALTFASFAFGQFGRGGGDWMAVGGDAQRTASVKTDPHISVESVQGGVMQPLWKLKLNGAPTPPVIASRLITYKGFKDLVYVGTSTDNVAAIDHVVGKVFWESHLPYDSLLVPVKNGTATCPAGMTAAVSLAAPLTAPVPGAGRGRGPGGPGRGMVTTAPTLPRPRRTPGVVYALSSDGLIHTLNQHTGTDIVPAARFIRGNAKAHDVISVANVVYAVTSDSCGGAPNGVWSIDLTDNMVSEYKTGEASVEGLAFGTDGTVFATTSEGLVSLEQKKLKLKEQHAGAFATSPLVFKVKDKEYVAAGSADGHVIAMDAATLAVVSNVSAGSGKFGSALASWEDADSKTRWILAQRGGNIVAFKVVEEGGSVALQQGWTSRELVSPAPPIVVNGVVFALSSGSRTAPAVLYALNGTTGKELWSSGKSIATYSTTGLSSGASKVFVGTHDGTLYAFGYMLNRE